MEDEIKTCSNCPHPAHAGAKCSECDCDMSAEGSATTEAEPQM